MTQLNTTIDDEIMDKFRKAVFKKKGFKKGNIKESIEEAMKLWIEEQK